MCEEVRRKSGKCVRKWGRRVGCCCCCCMTPNPQSSRCTLPRGEVSASARFLFSSSLLQTTTTVPLHYTALHFTAQHFTSPHFFLAGRGRKPGSECRSRRRWFRRGCAKNGEIVKEGKGRDKVRYRDGSLEDVLLFAGG